MELLKKLSIYIMLLALCFLCAPVLSTAQSPGIVTNEGGGPTGDNPKPPPIITIDPLGNGLNSDIPRLSNFECLEYELQDEAFVEIRLYDGEGTISELLRSDWQQAGFYSLAIDNNKLSPGIYFYDITINNMPFIYKFVKN